MEKKKTLGISYKESKRTQYRILRNEAVVVSTVYAIFGVLWILLSDRLLGVLIQNPQIYREMQTYKGWGYILITTIMVFILIRTRMCRLKRENERTMQAYERIRFLAYYDTLTGLPNRYKFENEVSTVIEAMGLDGKFIIADIDIDNFKNINNTMGHQVGDLFLSYFTDRLKEEITKPAFLSRIGGDQFKIIFFNMTKEEVIFKLEAIKQKLTRSWTIENIQFYISISIGLVEYPEDGVNTISLLKNVEIALHTAKREGKNRIVTYKKDIEESNVKLLTTIDLLQCAIEEEQFTLYYQPQFDLKTTEIVGVETLVRWIHPEYGFIPPVEFIPIAEETGQIYRLEQWIIGKAMEQKKQWETEGFQEIVMSINLSGKTLTSSINFKEVEEIIKNAEVEFDKVVIEITETASMSDMDIVIKHLNELKKIGVRIALDDFGTGYSSLNYLKLFPINYIKLDRSFINAINDNEVNMLLIKNILALARDLEFEVVAEGIETMEQLEFLKKHLCETGQGYLFSKPVPIDQMNEMLSTKYNPLLAVEQ
ncbi:MAG: bifunctional diguanylate cyclase/phosphodiesterase [Mobilitalea sp.]